MNLAICAFAALAVAAGNAGALRPEKGMEPRTLVNVPAPDVLGHLNFALAADARAFLGKPDLPDEMLLTWGPALKLGAGILDRAEVGVEAVSAYDPLDHITFYLRVLALEEGCYWPAVGIGAFDLGADEAPNQDAGYPVTNVSEYQEDGKTNNSVYLILAKTIPEVHCVPLSGRIFLGAGRGRFLARGGKLEDLGILAGAEICLADLALLDKIKRISDMRLLGELDGRSVNIGIETCLLPFPVMDYDVALNLMVQGKYLQNVRSASRDLDLRPALAVRIEAVVSRAAWGGDFFSLAK